MKRFGIVLTGVLGVVLFGSSREVFAQTLVKDEAQVLSADTEAYIDQLNNEKFAQLYGEPEYAVVTIASLEGDSIEEAAQELFDEYKIGKPAYNNGLLFVMAVADQEFRMAYGDGFATVFQDMTGDDWVGEAIKDQLRAEDYDGAIRQIADDAYEIVWQVDQDSGLAQVYAQGPVFLQEQAAATAAANERLAKGVLITGASVLGLSGLGTAGYFFLRRRRTQQRFAEANVIPSYLQEDASFSHFLGWAGKIRNSKRFGRYERAADCLAAVKGYLAEVFFEEKLAQSSSLNEAAKRYLRQVMQNREIRLYYAEHCLQDRHFTLEDLAAAAKAAEEELGDYQQLLAAQLKQLAAVLDLSRDILPENQQLLPEYRSAIQEEGLRLIKQNSRKKVYLAQVLVAGRTGIQLRGELAEAAAHTIAVVKKEALFQVDLKKVYQQHPDLQERMADFSQEEREEVLHDVRQQYRCGSTDYMILFMLMSDQITHQEETIAANNSASDFGGSGGMSSGGGASGSW